MIAQDSLLLLQCFMDIELEKFIRGETKGGLQKQSRIEECRLEIICFMESRPNAVFLIKNMEKGNKNSSMNIKIYNIDERNDHVKEYQITIAQSCETFKVERYLGSFEYTERSDLKLEVDFEKSKL